MPTIPENRTLSATSVDILNAIRNNASANYRDYVPQASASQDSVREIGAIIMNFPALQNEFLSALVNRIGRVIITSKSFDNPWSVFKKGILEFGETVEEIFVNIAKPFEYDPAVAENKVFAREIPDVRAAFHILNYQKFYKATIQNEQLRQAFLSWNGVTELIAKITESMYTGANYDEFLTMKYMLAKNILNGRLYPVQIPTVEEANMKSIISTVKGVSNNYEFMTPNYNVAGVATHTQKEDQYFIVNSQFDATMDVEVLASAFNMDKADFIGHRVLIDSFGTLDVNRLNLLFANDSNYEPLTTEELSALDAIPCVLVDKDWFMIFDNILNFTENYNGEGLYWNYWYHTWKTFSVSPFANATVFVPGVPTVTGITISPTSATIAPGQGVLFSADVTTSNFASKAVDWSISPETEGVSITPLGQLIVDQGVTSGSITVTATSVVNPDVTTSATVTIASGDVPPTPTPTVDSVTVSPESASIAIGGTQQFSATVTGSTGVSQEVTWSITPVDENTSVVNGLVTVGENATEGSTYTVTATSVADTTKSGSATITVTSE